MTEGSQRYSFCLTLKGRREEIKHQLGEVTSLKKTPPPFPFCFTDRERMRWQMSDNLLSIRQIVKGIVAEMSLSIESVEEELRLGQWDKGGCLKSLLGIWLTPTSGEKRDGNTDMMAQATGDSKRLSQLFLVAQKSKYPKICWIGDQQNGKVESQAGEASWIILTTTLNFLKRSGG